MAKITIFGLSGTGKSTAGKMLASKLGYEFMSTGNLFRAHAASLGMTLNELETASEETDIHDKQLDQNTAQYGKTHDQFVFESRLAWYFIPDSFKVCLSCPFDVRTSRIAEREQKPIEVAREETIHRETSSFSRYKDYYGLEDITNPQNFDLVVDTEHNNPEQVVAIIVEALKERGLVAGE
jgi:cytidylate kinase